MEPTICIDKATAELTESIGASIELPEDAIKIVAQRGESVDFVVTQLFEEGSIEMISVQYRDSVDSTDCDQREDIASGDKKTYEAVCFEGYTDVGIFVFVGDGFDESSCESCKAPAENSTEYAAFYFELSCEPLCETESPTEAPSGSMYPSSPPTGAPSLSMVPTECIDQAAADLIESIGAPLELPEDAVKIVGQRGESVEFAVTQLFEEGSIQMISVHYHDS